MRTEFRGFALEPNGSERPVQRVVGGQEAIRAPAHAGPENPWTARLGKDPQTSNFGLKRNQCRRRLTRGGGHGFDLRPRTIAEEPEGDVQLLGPCWAHASQAEEGPLNLRELPAHCRRKFDAHEGAVHT